MTTPVTDLQNVSTNYASPPEPHRIENTSWLLRHPGAVLTILVFVMGGGQWVMSKVLAEQNLPERKRVDSALRGIRRDMRTIATYQLESSRAHRDLLQDLADKQGVRYKRPPELVEAEAAVRKLKNR